MQQLYYIFLLISFLPLTSTAETKTDSFYDIHHHTTNDNPYAYDINMSKENHFQLSLNAYEQESINTLNPKYERLVKELAYLQVFAIGTIGVIASLPEGVSNWSQEDKQFADVQELLNKHSDNIRKGPALDNDSWAINYVGHSVAGSYFYVWGRQSGLSWQESAMLTALMSTFFWEYGWEAFAETPSTQDLIITPLLGSLLGEGTNYLYNRIMDNSGKIYNSSLLGHIGKVILNPIGEVNAYLDSAFDAANIEISVDYAYTQNEVNFNPIQTLENYEQVQSYFKLNFKFKY